MPARALRARSDHFNRVIDVDESSASGDSFGPALDRHTLDFDRATTGAATHVMMVGIRLALPVEDLPVGSAQRVHQARLGKGAELVVHRGQPDRFSPTDQGLVYLLSTPEPTGLSHHTRQSTLLAGRSTRPSSTGAGLWFHRPYRTSVCNREPLPISCWQ